jgi:hypothetical protein
VKKTPERSQKRPSRLAEKYRELRQLRKKVGKAEKRRIDLCGRAAGSVDAFKRRDPEV